MSNGDVYRLAGANNRNCDSLPGYEEVPDLNRCKSFVRMSGKTFKETETDGSYPIGCYAIGRSKTSVYFNYASNGGRSDQSFPICFKS